MPKKPRIALLVETAREYGRNLLRGIVRYGHMHGPWGFHITPGDFTQVLPQMRSWGGTGIIARIETPRVARAILASGLPTVALDLSQRQLRPDSPLCELSEVASDSRGAARLAAEHLIERGFRHYGFVGLPGRIWSRRRQEGFCECLAAAGFEAQVYAAPVTHRKPLWANEQKALANWLRRLPKPAALMACDDVRGREVLEVCRTADIPVPEEIAVIGVDNDELLCELADPPLSSVALNAEAGGYRAAALLDRLMHGRQRKPARLTVEALHVVTRRSTDLVALDDPVVASALRYIRDHAGQPIGIGDVVEHALLSRRALEMRFKAVTGRTPLVELRRVRLERAKRLLQETDMRLTRVASAAGFSSESYLIQVFRQELGTTPARYRRQIRAQEYE
jgi:LacI family transcriptional regulator